MGRALHGYVSQIRHSEMSGIFSLSDRIRYNERINNTHVILYMAHVCL